MSTEEVAAGQSRVKIAILGRALGLAGEWAEIDVPKLEASEIANPLAGHLPAKFLSRLSRRLSNNVGELGRSTANTGRVSGPYCAPYFAQDRLVSMRKTREQFPGLALTPLESSREQLGRYHRFRFRDEVLT